MNIFNHNISKSRGNDDKNKTVKRFDLNIDKILENWECKHALREIIANALDEQALTNTKDITISRENDTWVIRDFGRGLKTEHLIQTENEEKLTSPGLIGKFGIGLKDALATFDRHGVDVTIYSKYGDITIERTNKSGFNDIVTLHAVIAPPSKNIVGTEFRLKNIPPLAMEEAQKLFLKFTDGIILEKTKYGEVIKAAPEDGGDIYLNGVLVAHEPNFLFSYNITQTDPTLRKAINRERSNVSRTAYASIIRRILTNCHTESVGKKLSDDLALFSYGQNHDELRWIDVQQHAAKILANSKKTVFVTSKEIQQNGDLVNEADNNNRRVIVIPETLSKKIEENNKNVNQNSSEKITTLKEFIKERSDNFEYSYSDEKTFSDVERANYRLIGQVLTLIGGQPPEVNKICISETMQKDQFNFTPAAGVWDSKLKYVIIHRPHLKDRAKFLGVLLHELAHAKSGQTDATRGFEKELTDMLGIITAKLLTK